jgi:hypothetical protein
MSDHLRILGMPVSFAEVAPIWRDWALQPHRVETFKFTTDPQLDAKVRDVVGLYLDPPARRDNAGRQEADSSGLSRRPATRRRRGRLRPLRT